MKPSLFSLFNHQVCEFFGNVNSIYYRQHIYHLQEKLTVSMGVQLLWSTYMLSLSAEAQAFFLQHNLKKTGGGAKYILYFNSRGSIWAQNKCTVVPPCPRFHGFGVCFFFKILFICF